MQSANGAIPPPMVPPPMTQPPQMYGQQAPPPPQQWMMPPPQPWAQQVPPPYQMQPPQYHAAPAAATGGGGSSEIKSLWIGDLQGWMDEAYLFNIFGLTPEFVSVKVIRNKHTGQAEGYGFIEYGSRAAAEKVLTAYNGTQMPGIEQNFRLNWATLGAGEKRADDGPDFTIFVGDLAPDVNDFMLQETFKPHYPSVKGAKVVTDRLTGRPKGYGFVRFGDEGEQLRAMSEMNGALCSSRAMRIGPAATKKPVVGQQTQRATSQSFQTNPGDSDPNNTTIFVGALDENVSDEHLKQVFGQFGELIHVKIVSGKRCGFVQFADRGCAEQALLVLNGTQIGGQSVRLSWGRSPNKQTQSEQSQYGAYYGGGGGGGYAQGYNAYSGGYAPPPQDPNMYYGAYPGYGNYQQQQQQ